MVCKRLLCYWILFFCQIVFAQDYYIEEKKGWFWNENSQNIMQNPKKVKKNEAPKNDITTQDKPLSAKEKLKKQGEDWENALSEAILNPTPKNYYHYLQLTKKIQEQASHFSEGFKHMIWLNPEFDLNISNPTNSHAILIKEKLKNQENKRKLKKISQKYGFIFFYRGGCEYCELFSPILKKIVDEYHFEIIPISVDGIVLPEFQQSKTNSQLVKKLKIDVTPALFLINPDSNNIIYIHYGFADYDNLIEKIIFVVDNLEKKGK